MEYIVIWVMYDIIIDQKTNIFTALLLLSGHPLCQKKPVMG